MKHFIRSSVLFFLTVVSFACQKEIEPMEDPTDNTIPPGCIELTLKADAEQTKTTHSGSSTLWASGDEIKVVCSDGSTSDFTIVGGIGTATGDFRGYVPSGKTALYAVYPASRYSSVSGTTVKVDIPASKEGDFGSGNIAVANVAGDYSLTFKNVNSFISFDLPAGTEVTSVVVESVSEASLGGLLSVDCSGEYPAATATLESGVSSITATTSSGAGTYYIPIAPGVAHPKGFKLSYKKGDDVTGVYYLNKNITTAVNVIYSMGEVETNGNYYVTVSGAGNKNGMSWANAMSAATMWKKLHLAGTDDATDNAKKAAIDGATFHLAAGDYSVNAANINLSGVTVTVEGGYNASTGARNIASNATNLTGDSANQILSVSGSTDITFDGINFIDARSSSHGGAMNIGGAASVTLNQCNFTDNYSSTRGGAIWNESSGAFTCTNVTFSRNHNGTDSARGFGGAVAISSNNATCTFTDCNFDGNYSAKYGGAALSYQSGSGSGSLSVSGTTFVDNHNDFNDAADNDSAHYSWYCGAIRLGNDGTECYFNNCSFTRNYTKSHSEESCSTWGGAICYYGGELVKFNKCHFEGNHATRGGAVATWCKDAESLKGIYMNACSFSGNWSSYKPGTTLSIERVTSFCMNNCSFNDNTYTDTNSGDSGNWVYIQGGGSTKKVENCVISNCSLIGSARYSSSLTEMTNGNELIYILNNKAGNYCYFINNIIISPTTNDQWDWWLNAANTIGYNNVRSRDKTSYSGATYSPTGDKTGKLKTSFSTIYWDEADANHLYSWYWGGLSGGYDPKITKSEFSSYLETACPDFKAWLTEIDALNRDQFGAYRGDTTWVPGARN
ncbi:MAG: hypothetical protein IKX45_03135 [Bacteroidales bacterium]|nr:hypothetical protein [Bacteroidales bacterium]